MGKVSSGRFGSHLPVSHRRAPSQCPPRLQWVNRLQYPGLGEIDTGSRRATTCTLCASQRFVAAPPRARLTGDHGENVQDTWPHPRYRPLGRLRAALI
jgi:hypothetical protein